MRGVIQRVKSSSVKVDDKVIGEIKEGLLILLGVGEGDQDQDLDYIFEKTINLRIFEDEEGKMNKSLLDIGGELLVVSQFTLYGDVRKGRRPSFSSSAKPDMAEVYYEKFLEKSRSEGIKTQSGEFGADMEVSIVNDGPVTILLDSKRIF